MSETPPRVKRLIEKAYEKKATFLDLGNCGLKEIPQEIQILASSLKAINFGRYYPYEGSYVATKNPGLENKLFSDPESFLIFDSFTFLDSLFLYANSITDEGFEIISRLVKLKHLDVGYNQITDKRAEIVTRLVNLKQLDISGNQISDKGVTGIKLLTNLTQLRIGYNRISDKGAEIIATLLNLDHLHIGDNQITDKGAEAIAKLSNLTYLNIRSNQISDKGANALIKLRRLTNLDVRSNYVRSIETIRLFISRLEKLSYLYFDEDKIAGLPEEITNSVEALRGYFASKQKIANNLVKMILIGNTTAGKSSLADFLVNKRYDPQRASTHGIQLWRWKTSEDENALQVNIWDFGGQDYYHATHNLFLEHKTIFVLLHTSKDIHNKTAHEQQFLPVNYWLGNIRDIAGIDSPAWFIASKADVGKTKLPDLTLSEIYNVSEEFSISVKQTYEGERRAVRDFNSFSEDLIDELNKLRGDELPVSWVKIRDVYLPEWRKENSKFFTINGFRSRCEDALNSDADLLSDIIASWKGLLVYLKGCGEIVYFDDKAALSDIIFLSAEKITKDIYNTVLTKKVLANNGVIDANEIPATEQVQIYIEVLLAFELIFRKPNSKNLYIAPQYLPENPYEKMIRENIPLAYVIHFSDYMSRSLITKFIVKYASQEQENNYWRYGAYFEKFGLKTFVKINTEEQKIYVHIHEGKKEYRQSLLKELFLFFTKIAQGREKEDEIHFLRKEELIKTNTELSVDDIHYVRVQEIKAAIKDRAEKIKSVQGEYIKLDPVYSLLINEDTVIPKNIFLSYSHKDEEYKKELDTHFAALKRSGKIETWQDRKIIAGEDWDKTIEEALLNADIALLLLSPDFMASDYIWNVEIPKAIEKGVKIVPIFLRPCDFNESVFEIYKKQGLPGDTEWIVSNKFTYRDEAYLKVVEGIKKLL